MEKKQLNKLATNLKKSDLKSYKQLFDLVYHELCVHTNSIINDFEVSRDIIQEVFVQIWEERKTLPRFVDFKSYLYKISKNKALNYLKAKGIRDNYSSVLYSSNLKLYKTDHVVEYEELSTIIDNCIDNLPDLTRTVFRLNKFEMKKQSEIADLLSVSVKTVELHIAKAKREIKKVLEKSYFV
jgi:RNA polymerase sigma-70 factor (ECF subfamily)